MILLSVPWGRRCFNNRLPLFVYKNSAPTAEVFFYVFPSYFWLLFRIQEVQAWIRTPLTSIVWRLTCCFRFVAMFEWLRVTEFIAPRPQFAQTRAIE
jgi:hypothetical protein